MNLDDDDLGDLIRRHATRHAAPDALRAAVRTQVALADAGRAVPGGPTSVRRRAWAWPWRTAALSFALGAACAVVLWPMASRLGPRDALDATLVADHVRALQVGPLTMVASSDHHTVKPWFQGRLDYAPPVPEFPGDGFVLEGGRVERVHDQPVAVLTYTHQRHVVDVYVWPSTAPAPVAASTYRGFQLLHWADASMQVWAVTDMDRGELAHFASLWQAHVDAH